MHLSEFFLREFLRCQLRKAERARKRRRVRGERGQGAGLPRSINELFKGSHTDAGSAGGTGT